MSDHGPPKEMNLLSALRAAVSGGAAVVVFLIAIFINVHTSFSGGGFLFATWRFENMSTVALLIWFLVVPSLLAVGGALPALALGVRWLRSLPPSTLTLNVLYITILCLIIGGSSGATVLTAMAVGSVISATLVILVAVGETSDAPTGKMVVLGAAAFLLVLALGFSTRGAVLAAFLFGLSSWILLPAIAGLFHPHTDEPETELNG